MPQSESSSATVTGRPLLNSPDDEPALSHLSHLHLSPQHLRPRGESLPPYCNMTPDEDAFPNPQQSSLAQFGDSGTSGNPYASQLNNAGDHGPVSIGYANWRCEVSPVRPTAHRSVYGSSNDQDVVDDNLPSHTYPTTHASTSGSSHSHDHSWRRPIDPLAARLPQPGPRKVKRQLGGSASLDVDGSTSKRNRKTHKAALPYPIIDYHGAIAGPSTGQRNGLSPGEDASVWDSSEFHEAALGLASIKTASDLRVDIPAPLPHKLSSASAATHSTGRSDRPPLLAFSSHSTGHSDQPPLLAFSSQSDEAVQPQDGSNGSTHSVIMDHDDHISGESIDEAASPTGTGRYVRLLRIRTVLCLLLTMSLQQCETCHKRFTRPSALAVHTHMHTGAKPFTCPVCQRAFSVNSNLRR